MSNGQPYREVSIDEYAVKFGIIPENKEKREAALERAWKNRDFEIDKFWTRSAYFWGFIALIFGGYFKIVTEKHSSDAKDMYLDLYVILLGIIFSTAWLLVIKGSKRWQENWEAHIDKLENDTTGPLHKTVYYKGKWFFSVSKINEILAWTVIITWIWLLFQYFIRKLELLKAFFSWIVSAPTEFVFIVVPVIATGIGVLYVLVVKGQSSDKKYRVDMKGKKGIFVNKDS